MWQRFTDAAKKLVFYAQEEAKRLGTPEVDTEHLLLGFLRDSRSVAAVWPPPPSTRVGSATMSDHLLRTLGLDREALWQEVVRRTAANDGPATFDDMILSASGKRVISLAYDEARHLNNSHIGTEHLLLGLLSENTGLAGRILAEQGA